MIIALLLVAAFFFLIGVLLIRGLFRIDTQVHNQEAMIQNQEAIIILLTKLWEKAGADPEEISTFIKRFKVK
jgi:hypothetical protein